MSPPKGEHICELFHVIMWHVDVAKSRSCVLASLLELAYVVTGYRQGVAQQNRPGRRQLCKELACRDVDLKQEVTVIS